jgi:thiol-disulfide isomerase/thioredoxin
MRALMLFPAATLMLAAQAPQAPLDYGALKQEVQAAVNTVRFGMLADSKAGKSRDQIVPNFAGALQSIRTRGREARGEAREAALVAEFTVVAQFREDKVLAAKVVNEVPAQSPAWTLASDLFTELPELLGPGAAAYVQRMQETGIPEARAGIQAGKVGDLLEAGQTDQAQALLGRLEKEFPGNASVKEARTALVAEIKTAVGGLAPDFKLAGLDNPKQVLTRATFKGKYVLVDFWGTWCSWCVKELPFTHKAYAAFHGKGLEILSLASDKNPEVVQAFRKQPGTPMPWKHAFVGHGKEADPVMEAFGVRGFPALFLIGPDGKIVAKGMDLRGEKLEATLGRFLK